MAFKIASNMAFKKAMEQAKPVLMEPVYNLDVYCAESMMGDVIGDLNSKRGRILGMQSLEDGMGCVKAQVPYAEISEYAVDRHRTDGIKRWRRSLSNSRFYAGSLRLFCSADLSFRSGLHRL